MSYLLFLDDVRTVDKDVSFPSEHSYLKRITAKNYDEFVDILTRHRLPEVASFDFDLAVEHYRNINNPNFNYDTCKEKTGYHCLMYLIKFICQGGHPMIRMYCHSANLKGRAHINWMIQDFKNREEKY